MTRRDEYDINEKTIPPVWMTSRRNKYDVDEKRMPAAWMTSRHDEYDVDEDGGEVDAGSVDDSKMRGVRWSHV